jgi:hypothetical protein
MNTFLAVLQDLWNFVLSFFVERNTKTKVTALALPLPKDVLVTTEVQPALPTVSSNKGFEINSLHAEKAYVTSDSACISYRPVLSYDGVLARLKYGQRVFVSSFQGRFASVTFEDKNGWMLKDEITNSYLDVYPDFQTGEIYSLKHPDTKKLRKIIRDDFFAEELFMPLQEVEFVTYKLLKDGRSIDWPDVRPRVAGNWQNILKGRTRIQISITPKTGSIIEYSRNDGTGWLGYTKAVHIDDSIVIEGVGRLIEGEYREETFSKEEWHEWRPVWISVV